MIDKVMLAVIHADHQQKGILQAFGDCFRIHNFDYHQMNRDRQPHDAINEGFVTAARQFQPDWIFMQVQESGILSEGAVMRIRQALPKCLITHWMGDCRTHVAPSLAAICRAAHLTFVSSVGQIPMYAAHAGAADKVHYLQIGLDWDEDVLGIPDWTPPFRVPDVVFCGGYYGNAFPGTGERIEAVVALREAGIDVGVVSPGPWPSGIPVVGSCGVKQQHHIWKRAKVGLNVNHFNDIELYYSDRQLISMASGKPLVCKYVPGLEREFQDGVHCCFYRHKNELVEKVRTLLANPHLAHKIGHAGRTQVLRSHSWLSRISQILPLVEQRRGSL